MAIKKELFGTTKDGCEISRYWISNSKGMKAGIINYGAILVNLFVPDKNGEVRDIVLGYDTLEPYSENGSFFGATVGPNANRTQNASFEIQGKKYQMDVNDGPNNLHSHLELGYHKRVYQVKEGDNSVSFTIEDRDGSMGFPGNKVFTVTYSLSEQNELKIHYEATSDQDTILNPTNHSYFNLAGHNSGKILNHVLELKASHFTPVVKGAIPTGEILSVTGTPFDFTLPKAVGKDIEVKDQQLKLVKGYDHNFVIDGADGSVREIATVREETSGRTMKVFTDLPGVQFYAGNCIGACTGKENASYSPRCGLCLETQFYPDHAHNPQFPQAVFGPEKKYDSVTIYQFI